jgi:tetratricopeptide (TPR) repeat protein
MNHPLEAIMAIREQLAKFPNDFEGVILLANIQAEDMNDLPGAEITLNHFCASPGAPDRLVVAALTQLADWHLKKAADVDSARAALQRIVERFPDTEQALRAEQRLAHLGETGKIILAKHDRQNIAVPEGVQNLGLLDSTDFLKPKEIEPGKLAATYVKHLEQHPHDADVREKLATVYARDFQRLDLATLELEQLINEPRYMPKQIAGWLNLLASFQVELGADIATVVATLKKIVDDYPDSPAAELAQRRLARIRLELEAKKGVTSVKLGEYEQNIGLKYGRPRQ